MNTYLITGGAGFVGSHLADTLIADGHRVLVIDDLSTGSWENVDHLRSHPRFEFLVETIRKKEILADLVARADYVFHLAAVVGVKLVVESPVRTIETNVRGTDMVLEQCCLRKRPVLLTSTSEVYGKSPNVPYDEEGDLVLGATNRGRWAYACSKALDEYLAMAYYRERFLPVVVARLFNTVGPRQTSRYGMVIPRFVQRALSGRPITVYGDGTQRRCFGYVGDVVWGLKRLMHEPAAQGRVFNIGSQEEISILDLARFVKDRLGSSSEIVFVPFEEVYDQSFEDMQFRVPDLRRIREAIGYEPRTSLAEIVDLVAAYYRAKG